MLTLASLVASLPAFAADLTVSHYSATGANPSTILRPYLRILNPTANSIDLNQHTVAWDLYEAGYAPESVVAECWSVSKGACSDLTFKATALTPQTVNGKSRNIRVTITLPQVILRSGEYLELQWGLHDKNWTRSFNESDDWSFTSANSAWNIAPNAGVDIGLVIVPIMNWKGAKATLPSATTNNLGDVVRVNGESFVLGPTGWELLAESKVGPVGPQGLQGEKGDRGEQGVQGEAGPVGSVGPQGIQGEKGDRGEQGIQGEAGPVGSVGPQGIQGEKGDRGEQGVQGVAGPVGPVGPQGLQGEKGDRGEQGVQGVAGDVGPVGPQGPQGEAGPMGPQGPVADVTALQAEIESLKVKLAKLAPKASITDARDIKTYKIVTVGSQTWMAENLNYSGTVTDSRGECFNDDPANCAKYGRLYNFVDLIRQGGLMPTNPAGVQGICPDGWHIPTSDEWGTLIETAGGEVAAQKALRTADGWVPGSAFLGDAGPGTDDFGFSALPSGYALPDGASGSQNPSASLGRSAYWWTSSVDFSVGNLSHPNAFARLMENVRALPVGGYLQSLPKTNLFAVRCLKN